MILSPTPHPGAAARDRGQQMALEFAGMEWQQTAVRLCRHYFQLVGPAGALFEDARDYALSHGLWHPPSPNAWGAVSMILVTRGTIVRTGEHRPSKAARSHRRSQPVWRLA